MKKSILIIISFFCFIGVQAGQKSINSLLQSGKTLKIDSIVDYRIIDDPIYDSLLVNIDSVKLTANGLIEEIIKTEYDTIIGDRSRKVKYQYDELDREVFREIFFRDSITDLWLKVQKIQQEFNQDGNRSLISEFYSNGIPDYKIRLEYNTINRETHFSNFTWDTIAFDWANFHKTTIDYNENGDTTEVVNFNTVEGEFIAVHKITYGYLPDTKVRRVYNWNNNNQQFEQTSVDYGGHFKAFNSKGLLTQEEYAGYNTPPEFHWTKTYEYDVNDNLIKEYYHDYIAENEWEKKYTYDKKNRVLTETFFDKPGAIHLWSKRYGYDMNDSLSYYSYQVYDTLSDKHVYRQADEYIYNSDNKLEEENHYLWNDTLQIEESVKTIEYIYNSDGNLIKSVEKKGSVIKAVSKYSYDADNNYVKKSFKLDDTGKTEKKERLRNYKTNEYDQLTNRYISSENKYQGKFVFDYMKFIYNEDLQLIEVTDEDEISLKYYYDTYGRDSLIHILEDSNLYRAFKISYNKTCEDSLLITRTTYNYLDSSEMPMLKYMSYYSNDFLIRSKMERYNRDQMDYENELNLIYEYDTNGLIKKIRDVENRLVIEYELSGDTLKRYYKEGYSEEQGWNSEFYYYYIIDTTDYNVSVQMLPVDELYPYSILKELNELEYKYGKKIEKYSNEGKDHSYYHYSETGPMIGNGIIEGYVFEDNLFQLNEIQTTGLSEGVSIGGITLNLIEKKSGSVIAEIETDDNGFFKFRGVPIGDYSISIIVEGGKQLNTYDINISLGQLRFSGNNFSIGQDPCAYFIDEPEVIVHREGMCLGDKTQLQAPEGDYTYLWNNGSTVKTLEITEGGSFNVIVTDKNGCVSDNSKEIIVEYALPPIKPSISVNGEELTSSSNTGNQWYLNGDEINGAIGSSYTIMESGKYSVQVTSEEGCNSQMSDEVIVNLTSVKETEFIMKVFPNPSKGKITISGLSENRTTMIAVYNVLGERVYHTNIIGSSAIIDISDQSKGVYFVQFGDNENLWLKVIKE